MAVVWSPRVPLAGARAGPVVPVFEARGRGPEGPGGAGLGADADAGADASASVTARSESDVGAEAGAEAKAGAEDDAEASARTMPMPVPGTVAGGGPRMVPGTPESAGAPPPLGNASAPPAGGIFLERFRQAGAEPLELDLDLLRGLHALRHVEARLVRISARLLAWIRDHEARHALGCASSRRPGAGSSRSLRAPSRSTSGCTGCWRESRTPPTRSAGRSLAASGARSFPRAGRRRSRTPRPARLGRGARGLTVVELGRRVREAVAAREKEAATAEEGDPVGSGARSGSGLGPNLEPDPSRIPVIDPAAEARLITVMDPATDETPFRR